MRDEIVKYQRHINQIQVNHESVCVFCSLFVIIDFICVANDDFILFSFMKVEAMSFSFLDVCEKTSTDYKFCKNCWIFIRKSKSSKFEFFNLINVVDFVQYFSSFEEISNQIRDRFRDELTCQCYSIELQNLILMKKTTIAHAHFIISIVKLRSSDFESAAFYQCIHDHVVIFFKNSSFFLILLFSRSFDAHNVVRIMWTDTCSHIEFDLRFFVFV